METALVKRSTCRSCGSDNLAAYGWRGGFTLDRCLRCGLVFVREEVPADFVRDLYRGQDCQSYVSQDEETRCRINVLLDQVAELNVPGRRVLDVGCGAGLFLEEASKRGMDCTGIDADPSRVQFCRDRGLKVICGILPHPELAGRQFDLVWMSHVIEHVPDPSAFLRDVVELLAPGGVLCVLTPNVGCVSARVCKSHARYIIPPEHLTYWSKGSLKAAMERAGLRAERVYAAEGRWQLKDVLAHTLKLQFLRRPAPEPPKRRFTEGRGEPARLAYKLLVGLDSLAAPLMGRLGGCELRGIFRKAA